MKFKKLLPMFGAALLGVGLLAGCTNGGSKDDGKHTLSVLNTADLKAEWRVGGATRNLQLSLKDGDLDVNPLMALGSGNLKVESSNPAVLSANGLALSAVAAGTAKVTIKYYSATEALDFTILPKLTAKDLYGTVHEGTLADPLDNADALLVGSKVEGTTDDEYYVKGKVATWYHRPGERSDGVTSWFIEKGEGDEKAFEVYKCTAENGDALTDQDVWKGGTAVAYGAITVYSGQVEFSSSKLVSCEGGTKPGQQQTITKTVAEAVTMASAFEDGDSDYDLYQMTGYILAGSGNNFFMADTKDASTKDLKKLVEIYGINYVKPVEEQKDKFLYQAKVKVTAQLKNYHGQVETIGQYTVEFDPAEPGTDWPENVEINIAATPVVGTKYKLAMLLENNADVNNMNYFSTGALSGNYGATDTMLKNAADFEVIEVEGGYNVKVTLPDGTTVKYMNMAVSQDYTNVKFDDAATTVWQWEATAKTFYTTANGHKTATKDGDYFVGTYQKTSSGKTSTYTTLSCSELKYITGDNAEKVDVTQFPVHLATPKA